MSILNDDHDHDHGHRHHDHDHDHDHDNRRQLIPNGLTDDDKNALLAYHNDLRSRVANGSMAASAGLPIATDMNAMLWDPALASVAQSHADQCQYMHNSDMTTDFQAYANDATFVYDVDNFVIGENIYYGGGPDSIDRLLPAITAWFNEYQAYDYQTDSCDDGAVCGHVRQLLMAQNRYLGCGYKYCAQLRDSAGTVVASNKIFFLCNYWPATWVPYTDGVPYTAGGAGDESCSGCDTDRSTCVNGLCAGCVSPHYAWCKMQFYGNCKNLCTANKIAACVTDPSKTTCNFCRKDCERCPAEYLLCPAASTTATPTTTSTSTSTSTTDAETRGYYNRYEITLEIEFEIWDGSYFRISYHNQNLTYLELVELVVFDVLQHNIANLTRIYNISADYVEITAVRYKYVYTMMTDSERDLHLLSDYSSSDMIATDMELTFSGLQTDGHINMLQETVDFGYTVTTVSVPANNEQNNDNALKKKNHNRQQNDNGRLLFEWYLILLICAVTIACVVCIGLLSWKYSIKQYCCSFCCSIEKRQGHTRGNDNDNDNDSSNEESFELGRMTSTGAATHVHPSGTGTRAVMVGGRKSPLHVMHANNGQHVLSIAAVSGVSTEDEALMTTNGHGNGVRNVDDGGNASGSGSGSSRPPPLPNVIRVQHSRVSDEDEDEDEYLRYTQHSSSSSHSRQDNTNAHGHGIVGRPTHAMHGSGRVGPFATKPWRQILHARQRSANESRPLPPTPTPSSPVMLR